MKLIQQGLSLALLGAGLAAVPTAPALAAPTTSKDEPSIVERMQDEARGTIRISEESATGRVGFVRTATGDLLPSADAGTAKEAAAKAGAYLDTYAAAFGARPGELQQTAVREARGGWTVEYAQSHRGVPVFAAELRAHVDEQGDLTAVNGFAVPGLDLDVTPRLSKEDASAKALRLVAAAPSGARGVGEVSGLQVVSNELMVYRMGTTRGVDGEPVLAWVLEVTNEHDIREMLILDARTGKPVNRWSMIAHALHRELYEVDYAPENLVWEESDGAAGLEGLDSDQTSEVLGAGETYWMFMNTFGYDSYDGEGAVMRTVNNDPDIECPNANWNGITTNYCSDVSSDDTVAHEWGHAYTEYTSGLIYQWQSGAMNEAYSDIWGETVDMLNDRQNADQDELREEGSCSQDSAAQLLDVDITAPAAQAGPCVAVPAATGPDFPAGPATVEVVVGLDEEDEEAGDLPTDGCSPFTNAAEIDGNWVYVDENLDTGCGASDLPDYYEGVADNAIAAGAEGIIVGGDPAFEPWNMPGAIFTIPAMQVDGDSGARFRAAGTATVTISASEPPGYDDPSARWLSGEEDAAFGGAIRDMWNPTCYGHPGKVSDEEYHCETSDSGGVHINSGVVNHAYALLVDGSTYNGVTVPAIGLDKAANVFWQAQLEYLTPSSDFADLADALAASCTDLVGEDINAVTLGSSPTGGSQADPELADEITAADCAAVVAATQAVELASEPVQCEFGPLLAKNTPALCGTGFTSKVTWSEDFEDGLAGWTQDEEVVYPGASGIDWAASTTAPGGRTGGVAYAADPTTGSCEQDADDLSGRNGLISPAVTVPTGDAQRLSFDHYVATEVLWDGGNVKVSVNGGAFALIPPSAYVFNAPGGTLESAAEENTNPMAGEPAFTGTDGGEVTGSWGTSIVDLSKIPGASAGASLKFRFDLGRDGCNGVDGWYVDNVKVEVCEKNATTPTPPTPPTPEPAKDSTRTKVKLKPGKVDRGDTFKVIAKVRSRAGDPRGKVRIKVDGKKIDTVRLDDGRAVLKVRATFKKGKHKVVATYLGSRNYKRSTDDARLRVKG